MQAPPTRIYYPSAKYDEAFAFYRDLVGFSIQSQYVRPDGRRAVIFKTSCHDELEFFEANHDTARIEQGGFRIEVDNLDEIFSRLAPIAEAGPSPIRSVNWGERLFNVTAPDGMIVQFYTADAANARIPFHSFPMGRETSLAS